MISLVAVLGVLACGGDSTGREIPQPTLGNSAESERALRPLVRRWKLGTKEQRQALDGRFIDFAKRHEGDALVRLAQVLRAFNAVSRSDLEQAVQLVEGPGAGDPRSPLFGAAGTTRDLAMLAMGAVERRRGEYQGALLRLRPLLHKLLDSFATTMLNEELVHAAIGARQWLDAVTFMEVWQREAEPGSERDVSGRVKELLARVPRRQLLSSLDRRVSEGRIDDDRDMARLIAQQVAVMVVTTRDVNLARKLLDRYGPLLGGYGEAVARLAVDTARGGVLARTVGVLMGLRTTALRRRSADVVRGMSFGLGIPGSDARLVTRDADAEALDVRRALTELAGEGAAVIVAGIDPEHNAEVAAYARDESLPVLLLTPDGSGVGDMSPFVFTVGADPDDTVALLARQLEANGARSVATFGGPLQPGGQPDIGPNWSCSGLTTAPELRAAGVDAVVVHDGGYCSRQLVALASSVGARMAVGLGVTTLGDPPAGAPVLASGVFPIDLASPDARITAWLSRGRDVPNWWVALGHDAAVIGWSAVQDLKESSADRGEVKARRVEAASALSAARVTLWSSDAEGFGDQQQLAREIRVSR